MFDFNPAYQSQGYTNQKLGKIPYLVQRKSEMPKNVKVMLKHIQSEQHYVPE